MNFLMSLRNRIADYLWVRTIRRHHSRMGWRQAPVYSKFLEKARSVKKSAVEEKVKNVDVVQCYNNLGYTSIYTTENKELADSMLVKVKLEEAEGLNVWDDEGRYQLGDIYTKFPEINQMFQGEFGFVLRNIFKTEFKIFYGIMYKSEHIKSQAEGSQLWHSDSGPGTCINLMFCISRTNAENGAMEFIPWNESLITLVS